MSTLIADIADAKARLGEGKNAFSMEFVTIAGRRRGAIPEFENRLSVDGAGRATYFRRRPPGESAARAPGRFFGTLQISELEAFLDRLAHSGIENYNTEAPGPRDPVSILRVDLGGKFHSFSWNPSRTSMPKPMVQLKNLLSEWNQNACPEPVWSLALKVDSMDISAKRVHARVRIENSGTQEIRIFHPDSPGLGAEFGLHLKYGEAQLIQEGITPPMVEEQEAVSSGKKLDTKELIRVLPGQPYPIEYSATLEGEAPRGWVGVFEFRQYLLEDRLAGNEVFNGVVFSEDLAW